MCEQLNQTIPVPLLFNSIKHHAGFLRNFIKTYAGSSKSLENISKELRYIGHSLTDLYYGSLTPEMIALEVINYLESNHSLELTEYKKFLAAENTYYKIVELSDSSNWVLRRGNDTERFVHIHPGKHTVNTIRVRALTLKSAILVNISLKKSNLLFADLKLVNQIRTKYLNESPQKHFSYNYGVGKIISLLGNIKQP